MPGAWLKSQVGLWEGPGGKITGPDWVHFCQIQGWNSPDLKISEVIRVEGNILCSNVLHVARATLRLDVPNWSQLTRPRMVN